MKKLFLALAFIFVFSISFSISAISQASVCCEKTSDSDGGLWCVNAEETVCDNFFQVAPTSCEETSYCALGTCYDSSEGICSEQTPQRVCQESGGVWDPREIEEIPQCQPGCCIISNQAAFIPLVRCKKLSSLFGIEMSYDQSILSESQCIASAQEQDTGACVYEQDFATTCIFTTRKDCGAQEETISVNGTEETIGSRTFYKDILCSHEQLATECARQVSTGCYQGDVYWFDSCGNKENIYSSDKDASFADGRVTDKDKICSRNDGSDPDCGNCDYFSGTSCAEYNKGIFNFLGQGKPEFGDYACRRNDCKDDDGEYKNGESWCVYAAEEDAQGTDSVGSRYFRKMCLDGEIVVEPCADYRNEVCLTQDIDDFSYSGCVINRWQDCLLQDEESDCENSDARDCYWTNESLLGLWVAEGSSTSFSNPTQGATFSNPAQGTSPITGNFLGGGSSSSKEDEPESTSNRVDGVCLPRYTPGLKHWDSSSESQCSLATAQCVSKFVKKLEDLGEVVEVTVGNIGGEAKDWSGYTVDELLSEGFECEEDCECLEDGWAVKANNICKSLGDCGAFANYVGDYTDDGFNWITDADQESEEKKELTPSQEAELKGLATGSVIGENDGGFGFGLFKMFGGKN